MTSCCAIKAVGKKEEIQRNGVCVPKSLWDVPEPCCPGNCKYLPGLGKRGMNSCFFLLAHAVFALPLKLLLSQHMSFHIFTLLVVSPSQCGKVSKLWHGAELPAKAEHNMSQRQDQFRGFSVNAPEFPLNFPGFAEGYSGLPKILVECLFLNLTQITADVLWCFARKKLQFFFDYFFGFHQQRGELQSAQDDTLEGHET